MVSEALPSEAKRCSGPGAPLVVVTKVDAFSKSFHSRMKRVSDVSPSPIGRVKTAPTSPLVPSSAKRLSRRTPGPSCRLYWL